MAFICVCRYRIEDEPNVCGRCSGYIMALVDNTIQKFVESNYPAIKSVLRHDDKLLLECGLCGKQLKIDAFDRVGISINSYASGLIRQVMDRHVLVECLKIREEKAIRQGNQYVTSGRKITLED